jgi:hypothetical protein
MTSSGRWWIAQIEFIYFNKYCMDFRRKALGVWRNSVESSVLACKFSGSLSYLVGFPLNSVGY